ncbi:MAG: hypothetical protein ACF8GE_11460 [Phycisphaerales bacterium JB043]
MSLCILNRSPQSLAAKRGVMYLLCLCLVVVTGSCAPEGTGIADKPVSWPELAHLDEAALHAAGHARAGELTSLREELPELLEAGRAVSPSSVPSNASDPQRVQALLVDLASLIESLASEPDDESLVAMVQGLHPVIENLMEAAGVPHVHANDDHDHDHGEGEEHHHP